MWTIETTKIVDEKRTITISLPDDLPLGEHCFVVTVVPGNAEKKMLDREAFLREFPAHHVGPSWPQDMTFRREEMYGDDGR